jgi:hypothetical protein
MKKLLVGLLALGSFSCFAVQESFSCREIKEIVNSKLDKTRAELEKLNHNRNNDYKNRVIGKAQGLQEIQQQIYFLCTDQQSN